MHIPATRLCFDVMQLYEQERRADKNSISKQIRMISLNPDHHHTTKTMRLFTVTRLAFHRSLRRLSTLKPTTMFATINPSIPPDTSSAAALRPAVPVAVSRKGSNASIASLASLLSFRGDDEIVTVEGLPHAHTRLEAR